MDYLKKGFSMAKEGAVAAAEKTKAGVEGAAAKTKEGVMYVGNKTKDGMVAGVNTVAQRTTDQANIVGDATVAGANELSQQTVEGMENAAVNSGLVNQVSHILNAEEKDQRLLVSFMFVCVCLCVLLVTCIISSPSTHNCCVWQEQEEAVALDVKPEVAGSGSEGVCGG
uniref:Gamma-synuclein n=1 Tax=Oncorhynchus mykiss TaxID=8022 RepID=A0A8C7TXW4_ONCMY